MQPRIGVYQYDECLYDTLLESYYALSNRELLCTLVCDPFYDIRKDIAEGNAGEYVLRERHRRWIENVEEHIGIWVPLPSFRLLCETSEWFEETGMSDAFFCDAPEWVIFGDDVDIAYDVLDKLPYTIWMDDNLEHVVEAILQLKPNARDIIVSARDMFAFYVVRSTKIEPHGIDVEELAQTGFHALSYLSNAMQPGDYPTYVLDDETTVAYVQALQEHEEWVAKYEARRAAEMGAMVR